MRRLVAGGPRPLATSVSQTQTRNSNLDTPFKHERRWLERRWLWAATGRAKPVSTAQGRCGTCTPAHPPAAESAASGADAGSRLQRRAPLATSSSQPFVILALLGRSPSSTRPRPSPEACTVSAFSRRVTPSRWRDGMPAPARSPPPLHPRRQYNTVVSFYFHQVQSRPHATRPPLHNALLSARQAGWPSVCPGPAQDHFTALYPVAKRPVMSNSPRY